MLNELDLKILMVLYELKYNYEQPLNFNRIGFENKHHAVSHLNKLQSLGYINFNDAKVLNNIEGIHEFMIWSENLDLLEKGYEEVKKIL